MTGRVALVLGGGNTVWTDVAEALDLGEYQAVVACNDIGAAWPGRLDAWASLHPDKFGVWLSERRRNGHPEPGAILGHESAQGSMRIPQAVSGFTDHRFPGQEASGSSGHFALKVALVDLGCDRAVLCGVPMTEEGAHFYAAPVWGGATRHRKGWVQSLTHIQGRAKSMSGWTASLLGAPDAEWFQS